MPDKRVYRTGLVLGAVLVLAGCAASVEERIAREEAAARRNDTATESKEQSFTPSERAVRVEKCDTPPKVTRRTSPMYSWEMMQNKVEGVVGARLFVGSDGKVKHVQIVEDIGYDSAERTRETLMRYEFEPATHEGEPVATWISLSVNWRLPIR
jgi:hypothetical protein